MLEQKDSVPQTGGHRAAGEFYHSRFKKLCCKEILLSHDPTPTPSGEGRGFRSGESVR